VKVIAGSGVAYGNDKVLKLCAVSLVAAQSGIKAIAGYLHLRGKRYTFVCAGRASTSRKGRRAER
jgi:hypothetical protein